MLCLTVIQAGSYSAKPTNAWVLDGGSPSRIWGSVGKRGSGRVPRKAQAIAGSRSSCPPEKVPFLIALGDGVSNASQKGIGARNPGYGRTFHFVLVDSNGSRLSTIQNLRPAHTSAAAGVADNGE
jgi:hypothetical protein